MISKIEWTKLFDDRGINFEVQTKIVPTKGNLVYEYNPLRNYRLSQNMYEYQGQLYSLGELWNNFKISVEIEKAYRYKGENNYYIYIINEDPSNKNIQLNQYEKITKAEEFGKWIKEAYSERHYIDRKNLEQALIKARIKDSWYNVPANVSDPYLRESGELVDFITDELNFSLNHPVHIIPQYSYDGSVNLIINDGINVPRLINTRFSATGKNTYEVVDRKGNNDTNIYDQGDQFDIDTSLYKRVIKIPKIDFKGVSAGGNLKVGNYHFYFKFSDADGNETDFVGESGLVSVFIGFNDYFSVTTGTKNQNSFKQVNFQLTNIDSSYDYVTVYYTRSTAEDLDNSVIEYVKLDKKFVVNNASIANIVITGFENIINISAADINLNYNIVDSVHTSAVCQNMLFLANVHKPDIPYIELQDLSLRFLPYLKEEEYTVDIDQNYGISTSNKGYIDPKFIYNKTGYWGNEIYRFGIVYILNNGELSPVFNIRGGYNIGTYDSYEDDKDNKGYTNFPVWNTDNNIKERNYIDYHEEKYTILEGNPFENIKGVVSFNPTKDTNTIYSLDIRVDDDTVQELKKLVRGYFFVRQTRIPTILAQGVTIGIDKESHTPTIPTADGFITEIKDSLEKTHVTTEDINDVNFISEGFLNRYSFKFEKKESSVWAKIGIVSAIAVAVAALVVATVFTCGAAGAIAGGVAIGASATVGPGVALAVPTVAGAISAVAGAGAAAVTTTVLTVAGAVAVGVPTLVALAGAIEESVYATGRVFAKKKLNGRDTKAPDGYYIAETEDSRKLGNNFLDRFIPKDPSKNIVAGIICPDYSLNQPYYNQIFTGNSHLIELANSQNINCLNGHSSNYFTNDGRHFYIPAYYDRNSKTSYQFKIIGIPDNVKCLGIDDMLFRSRAGESEEAWRYECIAEDFKTEKVVRSTSSDDSNEKSEEMNEKAEKKNESNKKINSDIIRGSFGSYLAFNDENNNFSPAELVNIYIPGYSTNNMEEYFYLRMTDHSTFYAITDRFDFKDIDNNLIEKTNIVGQDRSKGYQINAYRGDCYICQYTHRVNRNFNDPNAPYNDEIVDEHSWKDNYDPSKTEKYANINLGDVNAVQLGMWVTFKLRSSNNLNIRTLDGSHIDETAMTGHPRGYYPYYPMSVEGSYKHPDSEFYNKGFAKSVSEHWNFEVPDVPHIKNWFGTRIMYSDIHINDAYKNGFRVFQGSNYRDYTREYGEIVKLVPFESSLLCIFEHGIALIPVNERAVAGQGSGGNVYINTSNVLPENPRIISDMFGSQWPESILKVPGRTGDAPQYVYGVDTIAKKIWRTDGQTLTCISDFKVQEFLNNNITLGERELTPIIGIRNVKTHYNAFKRDVMFTFYDNTYGFEEKIWNLCWNELLQKFITFYSWVPSYMENINNIPFSFNRDTSKWIAKLGTSHAESSFADGVTLTNVIINNDYHENKVVDNCIIPVKYLTKSGTYNTIQIDASSIPGFIAGLSLDNRILPDEQLNYNIEFSLERDIYNNYKKFEVKPIYINSDGKVSLDPTGELGVPHPEDSKFYDKKNNPRILVYILKLAEKNSPRELISDIYYRNIAKHSYSDYDNNKKSWKEIEGGIDTIVKENYPIFKDITGKRLNLKRKDQFNGDKIVTLLNIKAKISLIDPDNNQSLNDNYYNKKSKYAQGSSLIDLGQYESTIAIIPKWNMQFLSTDFWKHGQAGLIDIADDIYPTYWYGKQHPFEFECVVVNDPSTHKIFRNLELVANKAKPESFHYEVIGESYDFAKDKPNMYFRQEARKALWQYNGADICYNRNFLKIQPKQQPKSADLPHKYYSRQDTINEIEDYYHTKTLAGYSNSDVNSLAYSYKHLSGAEIVYYPNRQEFRVWNHVPAVCIDDLLDTTNYWDKTNGITTYYTDKDGNVNRNQGDYSNANSYSGGRSIIGANCKYLEDRWKVMINPIIVCYKNEYKSTDGSYIFNPKNSTWAKSKTNLQMLPTLPIYNSPIPDQVLSTGNIDFPGNNPEHPEWGKDNALYDLYNLSEYNNNGGWKPLDTTNWLNDVGIYKTNFGEAQNRKEVDVRDKFMKVRIRYSGEELAVIDFLNTIYSVSYS